MPALAVCINMFGDLKTLKKLPKEIIFHFCNEYNWCGHQGVGVYTTVSQREKIRPRAEKDRETISSVKNVL